MKDKSSASSTRSLSSRASSRRTLTELPQNRRQRRPSANSNILHSNNSNNSNHHNIVHPKKEDERSTPSKQRSSSAQPRGGGGGDRGGNLMPGSLSKRILHLTRKIGGSISSSSCRNALDRLSNSMHHFSGDGTSDGGDRRGRHRARSHSTSSLPADYQYRPRDLEEDDDDDDGENVVGRRKAFSRSPLKAGRAAPQSSRARSRDQGRSARPPHSRPRRAASANRLPSRPLSRDSSNSSSSHSRRTDRRSNQQPAKTVAQPKSRGGRRDDGDKSRGGARDQTPPRPPPSRRGPSPPPSQQQTRLPPPSRSSAKYETHSFKAGAHTFTVDARYSLIRVVGSGAYGVVVSASDAVTGQKVAIKMIPRAFHDEIDAKRILREIKLLKHFRHENVIGIRDMMPPVSRSSVDDFRDVYIVSDLMETDLHRIIYSKQTLTIDHVRYFVYQILRALKYIHSANVLHRDLKPSNLLVNSNCDLKICDLGLARGVSSDDDDDDDENNPNHLRDDDAPKNAPNTNTNADNDADADASSPTALGGSMLLTEYVVTRWYRAPEIMLACHEYTKPIDVWSVGCIFAELLARKPYFPGEDYIDQLTIISDKLGKLPESRLDFVTSEKARRFMRRLPDRAPAPLREQFPSAPDDAVDLLGKMLRLHPRERVTAAQALRHPFLRDLHSEDDEPVAEAHFDFGFEVTERLERTRLRELIWEEIGDFRPDCLPVPPRAPTPAAHTATDRFRPNRSRSRSRRDDGPS